MDDYFVPKVNLPFERHQFRQMSQASSEKVDQFVARLRQKSVTCEFSDVDEAIRDQLIEKCLDSKLRRKFLEKENATLKDLQDVARAYEAVNEQMKSMESSSHSVNALNHKPRSSEQGKRNANWSSHKPAQKGYDTKDTKRCYNCNNSGHFAKDAVCPARDKSCNECGLKGHFSACCRNKRANKGGKNKSKAFQVSENNGGTERDRYAFVVDQLEKKNVGEVKGKFPYWGVLTYACKLINYSCISFVPTTMTTLVR